MDYVLKTEALTKIYGHHKVLDNFSMHIPQGAIYGLVGKNGAGKTTLLRIICGLQEATSGDYSLYGISSRKHEIDVYKRQASNFLTKQDYDLIVLDVNLPDGNGFDFCREVKERRPDTAVIFLTANDMESDMLKGYELGAEDYRCV